MPIPFNFPTSVLIVGLQVASNEWETKRAVSAGMQCPPKLSPKMQKLLAYNNGYNPKNYIKNYSTTATAISVLLVNGTQPIIIKKIITYPDEFPTTVERPAPKG